MTRSDTQDPTNEVRTITPSMAHEWAMCGGYFDARQHAREPRSYSYALSLGQAVHELIAVLERPAEAGGQDIEPFVASHWRPGRFTREDDSRAREEVAVMLRLYREARSIEPVTVLARECFIQIRPRRVDDGLRIALRGRIDRLSKCTDGTIEVLDFKTAGVLPSEDELRRDPATTIYQLLAAERYASERIVVVQWSLRSGARSAATLNAEEIEQGKDLLRTMVREMQSGAFQTTPGDACAYCPARLTCPALVNEADTVNTALSDGF